MAPPVMPFGEIVAARGGFGGADLDRSAEEPDLRGQGRAIDLIGTGIDRHGHQVLHRDQRVTSLGVRGVMRRGAWALCGWKTSR